MNTNSIVMWVIPPSNADWDCFKTPILQESLRIQKIRQVERCAFSEATRLFQSVGCVRNKLQFRTVVVFEQIDLWDLIVAVLGTRIRVIKHGETCVRTNVGFVQHLTQFKNESNLME